MTFMEIAYVALLAFVVLLLIPFERLFTRYDGRRRARAYEKQADSAESVSEALAAWRGWRP